MWTLTSDGSVIDNTGKVIFFSCERFIEDICLGNCCFICGATPDGRKFNNEHILPKWLLQHYDLFSKTITLPNKQTIQYDRYTVPCCAECNAFMGDAIEKPISEVVQAGPQAIHEFVSGGNLLKMFVWMGLIYLKTHLKDRALRFHQDSRKGTERIADEYEWERLHHIHCVIRCFYTGCAVETEAIGSFLSLPVKCQASKELFNYSDLYEAQTMLVRLGDVAMLAVFNDSGGAMNYFWQRLERITGHVSELQLREIMAELAYLNLHLKERPTFLTEYDLVNEVCRIVGRRPKLDLRDMDKTVRGALLHHAIRYALPNVRVPGRTDEQVMAAITGGTFTFLFDDDGKFIEDSWTPV